jgi:hypothetical protein
LACGPSKLGEVELDQQPIRNGKLPNLWGKSIVFGPNIQWVGKDRPSGLPGWKARLMVDGDKFCSFTENWVGSQGVGRMEADAIANISSQQIMPRQPRSTLPARLICAPGPFVGPIP